MDAPKWCCRMKPDIFTDTRVGQVTSKRIVNCAGCGKFSEGDTTAAATWNWNHGERMTNPIDHDFVDRLKKADRA